MSGVEIVGLVFGVLPLIISAMEHYESVKNQSKFWRMIKQKHKRACGRVIDCQLALEAQLEQLLDPLLRDHVVDEAQYDDMLANPGAAGWQRPEVQEALLEHLANRHSRYMEVLQEMEKVTTQLCKSCRVDDPQFQRLLESHQLPPLQVRANMVFQVNRLKYTLAAKDRTALLEDFEYYVKQLERLLSASKSSGNTKRSHQSAADQIGKKAQNFWKHAQNMHALLQQTTVTFVAQNLARSNTSVAAAKSTAVLDLHQVGLCQSFSSKPADDIRLGTLVQDEDIYDVYPTRETLATNPSATLADLLQPGSAVLLTRVQRYNLALTLAMSHLQYHATPWLHQGWAAERVCIQAVPGPDALYPRDEPLNPYMSTSFQPPSNAVPLEQNGFSQLGILLLELCFGKPLEEHKLWRSAAFTAGRNDPIIRHAVACNWLDTDGDVENEAGENYALAVDWTLKQAPKDAKDEGWRSDFVDNVVQPLQRCCESMKR
ncbi:hypothetical protein LTR56_011219 [Elasticomyces elasticus]|nr:hypothetical protein LTR56_011219 [Elasticomyces elasticus]KAK4921850.1 hypothetical protein LTR49_010789 [Elasticomyces elasticus]